MPQLKRPATHAHDSAGARPDRRPDREPPLPHDPASLLYRSAQSAAHDPARAAPGDILALQRLAGNRAVSGLIQAKLTVGPAADRYEQEADRVAEQVVAGAGDQVRRQVEDDQARAGPLAAGITPLVQRQNKEEEEEVQAKPAGENWTPAAEGGFEAGPGLESRLAGAGGGRPLPGEVRSFMEPRFGADFGDVRLHTGGEAARLSAGLGAQAFTHGRDVYLGAGAEPPGTEAGDRLLAHELTHVVQQRGAGAPHVVQRAGSHPRSFTTDGQYLVKLTSDREEFVYKNAPALGLSTILPKRYRITFAPLMQDPETHEPVVKQLVIAAEGGPIWITLKDAISVPKPGQRLLCIERVGREQDLPADSPAAAKFVMDIKIGTETKSETQFGLEGAPSLKRGAKLAEHLLLHDLPSGSRSHGYTICDGSDRFDAAHAAGTPEFRLALWTIFDQVMNIFNTMYDMNDERTGGNRLAFVGASVLCVFNLTRPRNSTAKLIDPDHPILMDAANAAVASRAPADVMTAAHYPTAIWQPRPWDEYQAKWKRSFLGGLGMLVTFFQRKLNELEARPPH